MTATEETFSPEPLHLASLPIAVRGVLPATSPSRSLRRVLVGLDVIGAVGGWTAAIAATGGFRAVFADSAAGQLSVVALLSALSIVAMCGQRLYLARVCSVRAAEMVRIWRASLVAGAGSLLLPRVLPISIDLRTAIAGVGATTVALLTLRSGFRHWLAARRRDGGFVRTLVVIGGNEEGADLCKLVDDHPELGFRLAGVVGDRAGLETGRDIRYLGSFDEALPAVVAAGATGVLVATSALSPQQLNALLRTFLRHGIHVQLSNGVRGIDHRRLRPQPLAHEPLFYVEPLRLARWQLVVKRGLDLVLTVVGGVFVLPLLIVAALGVKLQDRGPVLYKQQRIGRHGRPFTIYKFRTMIPNADRLYLDLSVKQPGRDGPLIKLAADPRRTRIGKILERTSIDELPQLWNVLIGEMSLVGPRPAQAAEVAEFDADLLTRLEVLPGITGLWQVEARDNPRFSAYRRYDLFYLENWSVSLDLAILLATIQRVALRGLDLVWHRGRPEMAMAITPHVASEAARP